MILKKPFIATDRQYFAEYIQLWQNFVAEYNLDKNGEKKPLSQCLRGPHMNAYYKLVHIARKTIQVNNRHLSETGLNQIDPHEPYSIRTTRKALSKALGVSGTSAYRYLLRLQDAKVIEKKGHGVHSAFELLINPNFLLIYDYDRENYKPASKFFRTEEWAFQERSRSNWPHCSSCSSSDTSNKKIMAVDNPTAKSGVLTDNLLKEQYGGLPTPSFRKNTKSLQKQKEKPDKPKHPKKEKSCAKKEKAGSDLDRLRKSLAAEFYFIMIELLFKQHTIYDGEKEKALIYLEQNYFWQVASEKQGKQVLNYGIWRLNMAASYVRRYRYDMSNIYPVHYLDLNNPKGFTGTRKWAIRSENDAARKKIQQIATHKKLKDREKLAKIIARFNKTPDLHTYNICTGYVKKYIPQFFQEFLASTNIKIDPKTTVYA